MKLKKIVTVNVIAMMLVSSIFSLNASAKNNADTSFDFNVQGNALSRSYFRQKEDRSAPYCHLKIAASNGFNMRIMSINNSVQLSSILDGTKGDAIMYADQKRLIYCSVMDIGRKYCTIGARTIPNGSSSGRAQGFWSPDSKGSYPYAN